MPLFQKTILKEFVALQNQAAIQNAYKAFQAHFGNPEIQKNILIAKEEQYQEGFLKDFFVDILGYTLNPQPNFNLITEQKNENDSKKADAAILQEKNGTGVVIAVIELKSAKTILLQNIEYQAFGYKNHHQNCRYVITSNFTKLRFYLDNAIEFEEFDLFDLPLERFAVLYTLLYCKNILSDLPLKLKQQSIQREEELTLAFYNDYQGFKDALFLDIAAKNKQIDKFTLFQKTQKFLDRIVFICFAEDKGMLPANLISNIIEQWKYLQENDEYKPLYQVFLKHFNYINKGFKNKIYDIFGYNGGLFAEDDIMEKLQITDNLLMNQCSYLSHYDFDSDIDVNVLGHIFEHSLNQLDEKRAELIETAQKIELGEQPKENGKRKVDGIFYTPAYVTAYMVRETVGKLCEEKKIALELTDLQIDIENPALREEQIIKLQNYENWLATIKVLDPACGSGAFLNQVLTFFIAEYNWLITTKNALSPLKVKEKTEKTPQNINLDIFAPVVALEAKIVEAERNIIHQILENNIFGVDLNEESVEITKLSLWLKTAQMRQKLNNLTENIKCGDSLIDDETFYTENVFDWKKHFDWKKEFPQIFSENTQNQGFTIIVGNPPYVRQELLKPKQKKYLEKRYPNVYSGVADLYVYFYAKAFEILQPNGTLAFITPNKWFKTKYGLELRKLLKNYDIQHIVDFFEIKIFDASTEPQIIILKNTQTNNDFDYFPVTKKLLGEEGIEKFADKLTQKFTIKKQNLTNSEWTFSNNANQIVLDKILGKNEQTHPNNLTIISLKEYSNDGILYGVKTGLNKAFIIDKATKEKLIEKDAKSADLIKPYAQSTDIKRWQIENKNDSFFLNTGFDIEISPENYFAIYDYLKQFDAELVARQDKGKTPYNLRSCAYYSDFDKPKILYIHTAVNHHFYYDEEGFYVNNSCYFICNADMFLASFLNSKVFNFYKKLHFVAYGNAEDKGRNKLDYNKMVNVPIPVLSEAQKQPFIQKATEILLLNKQFKSLQIKYLKFLQQKFPALKSSKKLNEWHLFTERDLLVELEKQKIKIPMKEHYEFFDFFVEEKTQTTSISEKIQHLENEINIMIYALYDLSADEIKIVEM
jgi:SAM-dependent methyltransferase